MWLAETDNWVAKMLVTYRPKEVGCPAGTPELGTRGRVGVLSCQMKSTR